MDSPPQHTKPEPVGPMVAIVIIVLVFALGGLYFFIKQQMEQQALPQGETPAAESEVNL